MSVPALSNPIKHTDLEACFSKATNSHYWHYMSLKCFNKKTYQSPKLDQVIREVEKTIVVRGEAFFNISCEFNKTPMHVAMECENIAAIEFLMEKGVSLEGQKDTFDKTPLDYLKKSEKLIQWLSENKSSKEFIKLIFNQPEPSALHHLFVNSSNSLGSRVFEHIDKVNKYSNDELKKTSIGNMTLLHIAVITEDTKALYYLLRRGISLKCKKDIFKLTPLQYVRQSPNLQKSLFTMWTPELFVKNVFIAQAETYWHCVAATVTNSEHYRDESLISQKMKKVSKKIKDDQNPFDRISLLGMTPSHVAAICNNDVALEFFIKKQCSTETIDVYGKTPLDYASADFKNKIVFDEFQRNFPNGLKPTSTIVPTFSAEILDILKDQQPATVDSRRIDIDDDQMVAEPRSNKRIINVSKFNIGNSPSIKKN